MIEYKKVDDLFSGLEPHIVSSKSLIEESYKTEYYRIYTQILETLDDGMEIELCYWFDYECEEYVWDVSINKELFDKTGLDFLSYLKDKGIYLENIQDRWGAKWTYQGILENHLDNYRIQYIDEEDYLQSNDVQLNLMLNLYNEIIEKNEF